MQCEIRISRLLSGFGLLAALTGGLVGCHPAPPHPSGPSVELRSPGFADGNIPARFSSCSGERNLSPALSWGAVPVGTKSLALIMYDRDSPLGANFVHWVLYDLSPTVSSLPEGIPRLGDLPDGTRQGRNGFGNTGYGGPCPPGQAAHRYVFNLYALDTRVDLPSASTEAFLAKSLEGHVVAGGQLTAVFRH